VQEIKKEADGEYVTHEEWVSLKPHLEERWKTFFTLLWETGIRCSEGLRVKRNDIINGNPPYVIVHREKRKKAKLNKTEKAPISVELFEELQALTNNRRMRPFPHTRQAPWYALRRACNRASINRGLHPQNFRHAFGRSLARADLGLSAKEHKIRIAGIMGLRSVRSVDRYYNNETEQNFRAAAQFLEGR